MIKNFNTYIEEGTLWGNSIMRSDTDKVRKEDSIDNLSQEDFSDYFNELYKITDKREKASVTPYSESDIPFTNFYLYSSKEISCKSGMYITYDELGSPEEIGLPVDTFIKLQLKNNLHQNKDFKIEDNGEYVIFKPIDSEKITHTFFLKVFKTISSFVPKINKVSYLKESTLWGNTIMRSDTNRVRKEDDIDTLTREEFFDYLIKKYHPTPDPSYGDIGIIHFGQIFIYQSDDNITYPYPIIIFYDELGKKEYKINRITLNNNLIEKINIDNLKTFCDRNGLKIDNESYNSRSIESKNNKPITNSLLLDIIKQINSDIPVENRILNEPQND